MIAKLKGSLDGAGEDWAVIDVGGVGYLVFCSAKTLARLPRAGDALQLFIETHVREDHIHLYGFVESAEREWFRLLLTVQGIGSKVALAILSALSPDELSRALSAGDKAMLGRAQGVGPKLAARMIGELKDKVAGIAPFPFARTAGAAPIAAGPVEDAVSALVNLGYRRVDAYAAVLKALDSLGESAPVASLVRSGLQILGKETAR